MINRNVSRRLEQLEGRVLPPENRVVLRIVFVNTDGTVAPGGFTLDPWAALGDGKERGARTPKSPQSRGR
jgi:hypothetical protein